MRRLGPFAGGGAVFLPFGLGIQASGSLLGLEGAALRVVQGVLLLAGLSVSVVVFWALWARMKRKQAAAGPPDPIDEQLTTAEKRLGESKHTEASKLRKLPLVLLVGPSGSTKTTCVVKSGLDPELLAGEVYRGEAIVPTSDLNVWFARDTVFLEAGGSLLTEQDRWSRLVRRLRPDSLAAAMRRRNQAPRIALVCVSCEEFLKPGASEAIGALGRSLRDRLAEVASELGIRLPVYVLFTKTDRVPYFDDFVRNLAGEEAQEVWGATIPAERLGGNEGTYEERQTDRLSRLVNGIFHSLALRRLNVLPRETAEQVKAGAYEFPREIAKTADLATQLMVELTRPSQLSMNPFLRGFYFTGVRAVEVGDSGPAPTPADGFRQAGTPGATQVFRAHQPGSPAAPALPPSGTRRVPQWLFLERVFHDVLLEDRVARSLTAGGRRVQLFRRLGLGLATAGLAALAAWAVMAWAVNADRIDEARTALGAMLDAGVTDLRAESDLIHLDRLRQVTEAAGRSARSGGRWLHLGLYRGEPLHEQLRAAYFQGPFRSSMWSPVDRAIRSSLRADNSLPDSARDYGRSYDALKAHLVMTEYPDSSDPAFLGPVLTRYWLRDGMEGSVTDSLAGAQFRFYAAELPHGNPYPAESDHELVTETQRYVQDALQARPFYRSLVRDASERFPSVSFTSSALSGGTIVEGAYTADGWAFLKERIENLDAVLAAEGWVLGRRFESRDVAVLASSIDSMYVADFESRWLSFLADAEVSGGGNNASAARALDDLSGPQSSLLRLFALVSRNTDLSPTDSALTATFQPVHVVLPPDLEDVLVSDENQAYVQAIGNLAAAMGDYAGGQSAARDEARQAANDAESAAGALEGSFRLTAAQAPVSRLLRQPIRLAESRIVQGPVEDARRAASAVCSDADAVFGAFPFMPGSSREAEIDALSELLHPSEGSLWGARAEVEEAYSAADRSMPGGLESFFRAADGVSDALFADPDRGPSFQFVFRPGLSADLTSVQLRVDGEIHSYTPENPTSRPVAWRGESANELRLQATVAGESVVLYEADGTWAVFRFLQAGDWTEESGGRWRVEWRFVQRPVTMTATVQLDTRSRILAGGRFPAARCRF